MKKYLLLVALVIMVVMQTAYCEEEVDWKVAPVITKAYELSAEKLYLEWEGNAPVYQVYVDGKGVESVIVNNAVISIKKGTHTIVVYPMYQIKSSDTEINLSVSVISANVDLAALGLDAKDYAVGTPSNALNIDYMVNPLFNASPDQLTATTDFDNQVLLSFQDHYNADEYIVTVKKGKETTFAKFSLTSADSSEFVKKENAIVSVRLDPQYLQSQNCIVPVLNEEYTFSVQLRKKALNLLTNEPEPTVIHESKNSSGCEYIVTAAWKTAPVITYASQIADGQLCLRWDHEDRDLNCQYEIMKISKTFGIKTSDEVLGSTFDNEYVISDLMNGDYRLSVVPLLEGEKGKASGEVMVSISNNWVAAPSLKCEQAEHGQVTLSWTAIEGIESFHITVSVGDSSSILRFVDLDYSKHTEFDVVSEIGEMTYTYVYDKEFDAEEGIKMKFEIYGIRHAADGTEQKSSVSSQTITLH